MQRQTGTVPLNSRPLPIQFDSQTKDHVKAGFLVKEKEKKIDPHARLMLASGSGGGGGGMS